jgi:hypothetical protein
MLHIPLLRKGKPYRSLDLVQVPHHRTRQGFVEISQANAGLIRRDLLDLEPTREALASLTFADVIARCQQAADYFLNENLPLGAVEQTPQDYVEQVSATTGLPFVLARKNMQKIRTALAQMGEVVAGLTRHLELRILDDGFGQVNGQTLVHSIWAPAVALKTPLVVKPGSAEPWTPYRMIQAFIRAGIPAEMFGYYPTDHAGANEILRLCDRSIFFGDAASLRRWAGDPRVELHGPGYSKIVIGQDSIDNWSDYLDVLVSSVLENSGRSCINASSIRVPRHGKEIADALAQRLASVVPRAADDEEAQLAPFPEPSLAVRMSQMIDARLAEPGARDLTTEIRKGPRLLEWEGCTYLLPTIILCDSPEHSLSNLELLFPFASVVESPERDLPGSLGPSLVVTAITTDRTLINRLTSSPLVGRLNLGPIPTNHVQWDQPHEGNLFDHLYGRRALQTSAVGV